MFGRGFYRQGSGSSVSARKPRARCKGEGSGVLPLVFSACENTPWRSLAFLGFRHAPLVPDRMSAYLGKRGRWIFVTQHFEPKIREPIFNVPLVVIATVVVLLL